MSTTLIAPEPARKPAERAPRTGGRPRRVMFDAMRLVAAYAIIWLHTPRSAALQDSSVLGRFAVPFFVCATIFFVWQGLVDQPGRRLGPYAVSRFQRIYLPFLAWSFVYLAFKGVKRLALPEEQNDFPGIEFLWTGSFYHLWFMPFILCVSLAVFVAGRELVGWREAEGPAALACTALGLAAALWPAPAALADSSLLFAWNALASVFWGVALAIAFERGGARVLQTDKAAILGLLVATIGTAWVWRFGRDNLAENLAGLGCTVTALASWSPRWLERVARLGPLAYGIYLSHLLFIKTAEAVLTKLGAGTSVSVDLCVFVIAAAGSTSLAWLLSRSRRTRWLAA